jgi:hypothetical protein
VLENDEFNFLKVLKKIITKKAERAKTQKILKMLFPIAKLLFLANALMTFAIYLP